MATYWAQNSPRRPPSVEVDTLDESFIDLSEFDLSGENLRPPPAPLHLRRSKENATGGHNGVSTPSGSARSATLAKRLERILPETIRDKQQDAAASDKQFSGFPAFTNLNQDEAPRQRRPASKPVIPSAKMGTSKRTPRGSSLTNVVSAALGNALGSVGNAAASSQFSSPSRRRPAAQQGQRPSAASPQFTQLPPPSPAPQSTTKPEKQAQIPQRQSAVHIRLKLAPTTQEQKPVFKPTSQPEEKKEKPAPQLEEEKPIFKPPVEKRSTNVVEGRLLSRKTSSTASTAPSTAASTAASTPVATPKDRSSRQRISLPTRSKTNASLSRTETPQLRPQTVELPLDSDESSDEDTQALRQFWHKLKGTSAAQQPYVPLEDSPKCIISSWSVEGLGSKAGARHAWEAGPSSPSRSQKQLSSSLPARFLKPKLGLGSLQTRARALLVRQQVVHLKMWDLLPDNIVMILGFLRAGDVGDFTATCPRLRALGGCSCARKGDKVRIIPNLICSSRNLRLDCVSLPHILSLNAQNLNSADVRAMITELNKPQGGVGQMSRVDFSNSKIKDPTALSVFLCNAKSMKEVDLGYCDLGDAGTLQVARGLIIHPMTGKRDIHHSLQTLVLRENRLTAHVASVLARMLKFVALKSLMLTRNSIGDEGLAILAEVLLFNENLKELDISENNASAVGLCSILGSLGNNRTLEILDCGGNGLEMAFGDAANPDKKQSTDMAAEVCRSVAAAQGLKELHLWRCGLNDTAFELLKAARPPNMQLNVASNRFSISLHQKLMIQGYGGPNIIF